MLDALYIYCDKWKLQLNISKTKIVIFSRGLARKPSLEVVSEYVYLGITLNFNGRFTKAINKQILKAKRGSYSIIAKGKKFELSIEIQLHLFDTCILPILLYGCEVWCFSNIQSVEIFHKQYCKYLLRLGTKSINSIALGELGWFKVEIYIKQHMLNFWVRLSTSKTSKLSLALYQISAWQRWVWIKVVNMY